MISCCLVGLLGGDSSAWFIWVHLCSCFWLVDWAGLEGLNGLTLLALALVLNLSAGWQAGRRSLRVVSHSSVV